MKKKSPAFAFACSVLCPGLGHAYLGKMMDGIIWFICAVVGYFLFLVPGLLVHFLCAVNAAVNAGRMNHAG